VKNPSANVVSRQALRLSTGLELLAEKMVAIKNFEMQAGVIRV